MLQIFVYYLGHFSPEFSALKVLKDTYKTKLHTDTKSPSTCVVFFNHHQGVEEANGNWFHSIHWRGLDLPSVPLQGSLLTCLSLQCSQVEQLQVFGAWRC